MICHNNNYFCLNSYLAFSLFPENSNLRTSFVIFIASLFVHGNEVTTFTMMPQNFGEERSTIMCGIKNDKSNIHRSPVFFQNLRNRQKNKLMRYFTNHPTKKQTHSPFLCINHCTLSVFTFLPFFSPEIINFPFLSISVFFLPLFLRPFAD